MNRRTRTDGDRSELAEIIRRHCRPMEPTPTGMAPQLRRCSGIRCVMFDIYGTILISGSGDIGTLEEAAKESAVAEAFKAAGLPACDWPFVLQRYLGDIRADHQAARNRGIDYPEVDVLKIWEIVLDDLDIASEPSQRRRLAVEYECRVNPVWPMPGAAEAIAWLRENGLLLGVVSNAQMFTPELFPVLFGADLQTLGFDSGLTIYSYMHRVAKPSETLFRLAAEELGRRGVSPSQTLYIGNDKLKDVFAAAQVGFRTALFAGDARSLRLREDDPEALGVGPDVVLTAWSQLPQCLDI